MDAQAALRRPQRSCRSGLAHRRAEEKPVSENVRCETQGVRRETEGYRLKTAGFSESFPTADSLKPTALFY